MINLDFGVCCLKFTAMNRIIFFALMVLTACGGRLSDEQRKRLHEGMEEQKIVKLSDADIVTAALSQGQTVFAALQKIKFDSAKVDSIANRYEVKIHWTVPGKSTADLIEQQLIEAYVAGMVTGSVQDNIQKLYIDDKQNEYETLLYSKPIVMPMPDGVEQLQGVWHIYITKKQAVLAATKK
jgi:hypothetical protein